MAKNTHSIGEAGANYTAYFFSRNNFIVAPTSRNAVGVDLVVCSDDGVESCNIQVKTSQNAYRRNRYGCEGYEWQVGCSVREKYSPFYWYSFVDLGEGTPDIYLVPSFWVAKFVLPDFSRPIFFLPIELAEQCRNNTDLIKGILDRDENIIEFASSWHKDLVHWGNWEKYF